MSDTGSPNDSLPIFSKGTPCHVPSDDEGLTFPSPSETASWWRPYSTKANSDTEHSATPTARPRHTSMTGGSDAPPSPVEKKRRRRPLLRPVPPPSSSSVDRFPDRFLLVKSLVRSVLSSGSREYARLSSTFVTTLRPMCGSLALDPPPLCCDRLDRLRSDPDWRGVVVPVDGSPGRSSSRSLPTFSMVLASAQSVGGRKTAFLAVPPAVVDSSSPRRSCSPRRGSDSLVWAVAPPALSLRRREANGKPPCSWCCSGVA
mmetsp:Transcript_37640/g.80342  ORF Transcript_37640/g.80342 Transcript_37640/m.80342 type:complete len:259 (+) Transcript_37640:3102-3878(+)